MFFSMGLSVICDLYVSWPYSFLTFKVCNRNIQNDRLHLLYISMKFRSLFSIHIVSSIMKVYWVNMVKCVWILHRFHIRK